MARVDGPLVSSPCSCKISLPCEEVPKVHRRLRRDIRMVRVNCALVSLLGSIDISSLLEQVPQVDHRLRRGVWMVRRGER